MEILGLFILYMVASLTLLLLTGIALADREPEKKEICISMGFGRWSHKAGADWCYSRIYFLNRWTPFVVKYPRASTYSMTKRHLVMGFSFMGVRKNER